MPRRMRREDRRTVAFLAFFHGAVHANVLAIPVFLLAWRNEFRADDVTLGLLASIAYGGYGVGSVPFGFLADRRSPGRLLVLCGLGTAASLAGIALSPSIPALALGLGAIGQILSGRLADRTHPDRILFGLSLVAAGILLALALLPMSAAFTGAALAFGFVLFSLEPLQNTLVAGEAPRSVRGLAFGFSFLSVFGVGSIGAVLAGWMLAQNAAPALFAVLGACLAVSGGLAFRVRGARSS